MMNKSSNTIVKRMRLFTKAIVFAMLFALVFGVIFTENTIDSFEGLYASAAEGDYNEGSAQIRSTHNTVSDVLLKDTGNVAKTAESFTSAGGAFPKGTGPWTATPDTFVNGNFSAASSTYVLQQRRVSKTDFLGNPTAYQEIATAPFTITDTPKNHNNEDLKSSGFTYESNAIGGNYATLTTFNVEIDPYIKELLNNDRYAIYAKIDQDGQYDQWIESWDFGFLYLKSKAVATANKVDAYTVDAVKKRANESDGAFEDRVFGDKGGENAVTKHYQEQGYAFSKSWVKNGKAVNKSSIGGLSVRLTRKNPNLALIYYSGTHGGIEAHHLVYTINNLKITYEIRLNPDAFGGENFQPTYEKGATSTLRDDFDGDIKSLNFKSNGSTFPNGNNTWTSDAAKFTTSDFTKASSIYVIQEARNNNSEKPAYANVSMVNTPQDKDGNALSSSGYTYKSDEVKGNYVSATTFNIEISPFIKQLLNDGRFTVKATVSHKGRYLQDINSYQWSFLYLKGKAIATPELYNASDVKFMNKQPDELSDEFRRRVFMVTGNDVNQARAPYEQDSDLYGYTFCDSKNNGGTPNMASYDVILTKDNPNLALIYLAGTHGDNKGTHPMYSIYDLSVTYEITYNNAAPRGENNFIKDGASPYAKQIVGNIYPYIPNATDTGNGRTGLYTLADEQIKAALPYDFVYYTNTDGSASTNISENILLSSYTKEKKKSIALQYEDRYAYESVSDLSQTKKYSSGIRNVVFSGLSSINGIQNKLVFSSSDINLVDKVININPSLAEQIINVYRQNNGVIETNPIAKITLNIIENNEQTTAITNIQVEYEFYDNCDISIEVNDFHDLNNPERTYTQTISVSGIDDKAPNKLGFIEKDSEYAVDGDNIIFTQGDGTAKGKWEKWFNQNSKWINNESFEFAFNARNLSELDSAKYIWYVDVIKCDTLSTTEGTGLWEKLQNANLSSMEAITSKTLLKVQGLGLFNSAKFNFKTGTFTIPGSSPIETGVHGAGYYAFCFYTMDMAGNLVAGNENTKVYMKVDYDAPKYTITTTAPSGYFVNNTISGGVWSHDAFDITLKISHLNQSPSGDDVVLNSFSGNYIDFYVDGVKHTLTIRNGKFIKLDNQEINSSEEIGYDTSKLNFNIKFDTSKSDGFTYVVFSFNGIKDVNDKDLTINTNLLIHVGVGEGKIPALDYVDKSYKFKKTTDSSVAQERGIKIRIETKDPTSSKINNKPKEIIDGVFDKTKYDNYATEDSKIALSNRIWNTSGLLNLDLSVDRGSTVYIAVANANKLIKLSENTNLSDQIRGAIGDVRTLTSLDLAINGLLHDETKNIEAMLFTNSQTDTGNISLSIPLFVDLYGVGIRNIYIWVANEAGRISQILEKSVLVDTTLYNINTEIDANEKTYFGLNDEVKFYINNGSSLLHRGDKAIFNIVFDDKSFIPYTINGKNGLTSNISDETVLFENENISGTKIWGLNMVPKVLNSKYLSFNKQNNIELCVDSFRDLTSMIMQDPLKPDGERKDPVTNVTYTLHIRKNINFGVSGSMDPITIPANKNGTDVKFWSSDAKALENVSGAGLIVKYFDSTDQGIVGSPIAPGDYKVSAYFDKNDPYYVTNVKFDKVQLVLKKYKIVLKIKSSNGFYGDTPVFQYGFFDVDGSLIEEPTGYDKNKQYLEIVGPKGVNQNRIPVGTYDIMVVDREDISLRKDLSDYDIVVENNTYTVNPRMIHFSKYGTKPGASYALGVSRSYKAAMPEVYIFIDKEQFKDGTSKGASYFDKTDYATLFNNLSYQEEEFTSGAHTYVVFKDILHSIDLPNVNINTVPGIYNFSTEIPKVIANKNINVLAANNEFMTINERSGIELTMSDQSIYVSGDTFVNGTYFGNLNYTVNDKNKDLLNSTGFIENIPFKLTLIEGNTYSVAVDENVQDEYLGTITIVGTPIITVFNMSEYFVNLQPDDVGKQYIFTQQKKTPSIEYGILQVATSAFIDSSIINDFSRCFDFIILEYTGKEMAPVNKGLSSFKLQIQVKGSTVEPGSRTALIEGGVMLSSTQEILTNVEFVKSDITINIVNRTLYVTPILKGDGTKFTITFGTDIKDIFAGINIVDKFGKSVKKVIDAQSVDVFGLALFNRDTLVRFATQYDDVLTNIDYHYGIVSTKQYSDGSTFTDFVFDDTKNAYYVVDLDNNIAPTEMSIKEIEVEITSMELTINKESFDTTQFVGKPYDGNDTYYNPKYNAILKNSVFGNTSIIFDIKYYATSGTTYVYVNNIRVKGNIANINITLVGDIQGQFNFTENPVIIEKLVITISQEDIVVKKAFDGTKSILKEDIILPSALTNMKFNVSPLSQFDSKMVGNSHRIQTLTLEFTDINLDYVEFVGAGGVNIITGINTLTLTINEKKGEITKRIINADDIESITPIKKVYDGTPDVKLSVQFKEHIAKEVQSLRELNYHIADDLEMIFMGKTYFNGEIDSNAHKNVTVKIDRVLRYDYDLNQNVDYEHLIYDVDLDHIQKAFNGVELIMDVHKALLTPVLKLSDQQYNNSSVVKDIDKYKNSDTQNIETTLNLGSTPKVNLTILESMLSNEGQEFANVVKNPDAGLNMYKHNILITGKLTAIEGVSNEALNNYSLNGFIFTGGQYKYFENVAHKTLTSIIKDEEEITFEILNAVSVTPIPITLSNDEINNNNNIIMVNGDQLTKTKVYDGTPDAQFKYIGDKTEGGSVINNIINNEAEIVINATYNSQNVGGNQIIKFNSASVKANKAVNEFSENNYNLINNLQPIKHAKISPRPLYINKITLKNNIEWNDNGKYDATFNDIDIEWMNLDGSKDKEISGFIADDKKYISVTLNGIKFGPDTTAKGDEISSKISSVTSLELEYSKLRGVMNYYVANKDELNENTLIGTLVKHNVYINLQPKKGTFADVNKVFDNTTDFKKIGTEGSYGIIKNEYNIGEDTYSIDTYFDSSLTKEDKAKIASIRVCYETKQAGSTKLMFAVTLTEQAAKNINLINDGKDSINATITPATIKYKLVDWEMPYGTRELEPQFEFTFNEKPVYLNKEDGLLYIDQEHKTVLYGLTKLNMPVLPDCIKENEKSYMKVNDGGVTDYQFVVETGFDKATITVVPKVVKVYGPSGMTKRYGEPNPENISLQYCDKDGGKAFVGLDSAATILGNNIRGTYRTYEVQEAGSDYVSFIYGLKVEVRLDPNTEEWIELGGIDDNGQVQNGTVTIGDNYTFSLRYPVGSQEYIAKENQLVVTAPQIPFTISDVYTTSYDGTDKLQNIVNGNKLDKEQFNFTYYVDGQETTSLKNVKDFALNRGVYQVKVYAKHKSLSGNTEGQNEDWKVFKAPEEGYQLTVGKGVAKTHCDLTINPSDPGFDLNKVEIGVGSSITKDNIIAKLLEEYVENVQVPKDKDNKSIIDLLKDNIDITLEYREGTGFTPIEGTDNRILKAGTYKIKVNFTRPETDDSPLYNFIQNAPAEIVKTIESIKVYIKQITLPEGFIEFKTDSKYIVPEFIEVEDRTDLDYIADELAVLYLGGPLQKYSTTINQTGTYEYKVVVIEDGKENLGYTVLFENGSPAIGQGLKIARKTISGIDGTANNKIESENLIEGVENLFVETMTEPSGSKWDIINRNVNALSTLKTDKSRLTAIVNIQAQNSNGKAVTSDIDNVKLTVKVPSKLSSEKSLQVFYIKYENGVGTLVELNTNEYDLNGDQLVIKNTALQNGAKELVFVSEDIFVMPTWAIVIITLAGVALISCIIAVAVKSIKGRRR